MAPLARRWQRLLIPTLAVLAVSGLAAACSAAAPATPPSRGVAGTPAPAAPPRPTPGQAQDGDAADVLRDGTHIIRTGTLALEVTDLMAAVDGGARIVSGVGGYIGKSEERHNPSGGWAAVTYRIPVERWSEALAGLRGLGRVLTENTEALDVTSEVVDLDARVANLRATEGALQAIMDRAATIDDVMKVQRELTGVRSEIERLVAQRENLAQRAAFATLTVRFEVPVVAQPTPQPTPEPVAPAWDISEEVASAVDALVLILQRLSSLGIWLSIVVLPVVLPFALVGYVIYRIARSRQVRATMHYEESRR
jgi:hypothetical protein